MASQFENEDSEQNGELSDQTPQWYILKCQVNRDSVPYAAGVCIYQDGHKFTFDSEMVGYTIKIVENEEILYSNLVSPSRLVSVPDSIKGVKGIKLVREEAAYCGVVYFKK